MATGVVLVVTLTGVEATGGLPLQETTQRYSQMAPKAWLALCVRPVPSTVKVLKPSSERCHS